MAIFGGVSAGDVYVRLGAGWIRLGSRSTTGRLTGGSP